MQMKLAGLTFLKSKNAKDFKSDRVAVVVQYLGGKMGASNLSFFAASETI